MENYTKEHAQKQVDMLYKLLADKENAVFIYQNKVTHEKKSTKD